MPETSLPSAYQMPALDAVQVQAVDTLITLGLSCLNTIIPDPVLLHNWLTGPDGPILAEYIQLAKLEEGTSIIDAAALISRIADQARRDTGRLNDHTNQ